MRGLRRGSGVRSGTSRPARIGWTGVLLALGLATPAAGQFGIRGGVNLTKFVGGDAGDAESTPGLNLGMSIPLFHVGPLALVPEVYYAQKGATQADALGGAGFTFDLSYIEVPVLLKASFPLNARRSVFGYLAGGPAFAWNVDCSFTPVDGGASGASACGETFGSFDSALQKADRGVVVSGGFDFMLGSIGLNLDARLVRGLSRLTEGDTGADVKNQSFALMLGYSFAR